MNRAVRVAVAIIAAYLFGWVTGRLPAPRDPTEFWIGNIGAPYLLVGFVAGAWATRRPVASAILGCACAVATVCGFYNFAMIWSGAGAREGLAPGAPWWAGPELAYERWLGLLLWGNAPWLTIAIAVGPVAGYLGHRWAVRGDRVGAGLVGAVLVLEPIIYATGLDTLLFPGVAYARSAHNVTIWAAEALAGVSSDVLVWRSGPGGARRLGPRTSRTPLPASAGARPRGWGFRGGGSAPRPAAALRRNGSPRTAGPQAQAHQPEGE
jgi:hypothetical protein